MEHCMKKTQQNAEHTITIQRIESQSSNSKIGIKVYTSIEYKGVVVTYELLAYKHSF